jgi:hypothetical protein
MSGSQYTGPDGSFVEDVRHEMKRVHCRWPNYSETSSRGGYRRWTAQDGVREPGASEDTRLWMGIHNRNTGTTFGNRPQGRNLYSTTLLGGLCSSTCHRHLSPLLFAGLTYPWVLCRHCRRCPRARYPMWCCWSTGTRLPGDTISLLSLLFTAAVGTVRPRRVSTSDIRRRKGQSALRGMALRMPFLTPCRVAASASSRSGAMKIGVRLCAPWSLVASLRVKRQANSVHI